LRLAVAEYGEYERRANLLLDAKEAQVLELMNKCKERIQLS
jgi:hypothetical protein